MDLTIANTIVGAILISIGWVIKTTVELIKETRGKRKSEIQKISDDRDKYRTLKLRWKKAFYTLLYLALQLGLKDDDIPHTPDDDKQK